MHGNRANDNGGGLYSPGPLSLTGGVIEDNLAAMGSGGGVYTAGSSVIRQTIFTRNQGGASGGGLFSTGETRVQESTFRFNITRGSGGAVSTSAPLALVSSRLIENQAGEDGGGVYSTAQVSLEQALLYANTAGGQGGGLYAPTLASRSSTVANNQAGLRGGGLYLPGSGGSVLNSLVAQNRAGEAPDCAGELASGGYNLLGDDQGCGWTRQAGDQVAQPGLTYFINAGLAFFHTGSPVFNAADPAGCVGLDGTALEVDLAGAPRVQEGGCDIGAFETVDQPSRAWSWFPLVQARTH